MSIRDTGVTSKSDRLQGKQIAVAICGGIAAVEVVKIIRELRRHGAVITPFMTPSSSRFVGPDAIAWAASRPVIFEAGPQVEYLMPFDLVLVAPATLNTITKAALALTDNVVSLLLASEVGRGGKLLFVPAMNAVMKAHPRYSEFKKQLETWGSVFLESDLEEDRLKIPSPETIAEKVIALL